VKSLLNSARPLGIAAVLAVAFGACDEQLNGGAACPTLCPQPPVEMQDTTFFAIDLDTTISGFPGLGEEQRVFVAAMGDTLQTAMIVRWDSLPTTFRGVNSPDDSSIVAVDSAQISLSIITGDTLGAAATLDVYDVDMGGAEEADPTMVKDSLIPARLIASRIVPADSLKGTISIPIDSAFLRAKIQAAGDSLVPRLRLAFRLREGTGARKLTFTPQEGGGAPQLIFRPTTDATLPKLNLPARSLTPEDNGFVRNNVGDYLVVVRGPADPPADVFRVGGLPGRRAYLRFNIPSRILDSSAVLRATLMLTQRPNGFSPESRDTITVGHFGIIASGAVTDIARAMRFVSTVNTDTTRAAPIDSAVREFEVMRWVRMWRGTSPDKTPRALALSVETEGVSGSLLDFFSIEAVAAVRPRLRLTYLPRPEATIP
jgi:hypothetical protein